MKAIVLARTGDPSVLEYTETPTPRPQPGEVLVKADTIGVSRPELLVRRGTYPWMPPLPAIPGIEMAGTDSQFSQTDQWQIPEGTKGDGRVREGADPVKGDKQWHGRFSTAPLKEAEFRAVLDVGCSGNGRDAAMKIAKDLQ